MWFIATVWDLQTLYNNFPGKLGCSEIYISNSSFDSVHCFVTVFSCLPVSLKAEKSPRQELILDLRGVTCCIGSHSVTCHPTQVNAPRLNPSQKAGTEFTYLGRMEGWVDVVYPAMRWPGVELSISRSQVRNHYTTKPPQFQNSGIVSFRDWSNMEWHERVDG